MGSETGYLGMGTQTDSSDSKDVYPRNGPLVPFSIYGPDKDMTLLASIFFIWRINAGPYRYWTTLTSCVGRCGICISTNRDTHRGELSGGVLSRHGVLGHSAKWTNMKHYYSSLHVLRGPTESVLSHFLF